MPKASELLGSQARPTRRDMARARRVAMLNRRVTAAFEAERFDRIEPLLKQMLRIDPNYATGWYNYACYYSRTGKAERAVECLDKAIRKGFSAYSYMERDPDLAAARKAPSYADLGKLMDRMQRKRADKVREALQKQFGEDYEYEIDHDRKLVFATNVDASTLAELKTRLTAYATAQWNDLFESKFDKYLTIVIPKSGDWRWGSRVGGFYSRTSNLLVARTVGLTLVHEFTHALHRADQEGRHQHHPIWVTEGLATLFESSQVVDGHAVPAINARLNVLQRLIRTRRHKPLGELVRTSHPKFMENASASYSHVQCLMMYLHAKGLLRAWYDAYCGGYDDDPTGRAALEKVLGKKLPEIEKDWHKWVLAQKPALTRLPLGSAYIGIQLRQVTDGVAIYRIVPGGGADKAKLKAGDVITRVDGERVFEPAELMEIVHRHEAGDVVKVQYRRGGKYAEAAVTLTKMMPVRRLPRPRPRPDRPSKAPPATKPAATKPAPATRPARPPVRRRLPAPRKIDRAREG